MSYIEILLAAIAVLLLIPTLVIFAQVLFACLPKLHNNVVPADDINIAVLIPAHNESSGIVATLDSIRPQLKSADRLLVVADNCNDDTAEIAAANGAEVIERHDAKKPGKGFALDFGIRHLSQNPPDVVVIIDADCTLEANSLNRLAAYTLQSGRPVQALDLMYAKATDLKSRIAEFAWCVKNLVRPLGYARVGLPCQLMGTGMAFPWSTISSVDLASGNIVEDMKLGIDLSRAGTPPLFYPDAQVTSYFPASSESLSGQRTRWEHGHLAMILSEAPRLFAQGITKLDKNLLAMAFDLSVPPLALLTLLIVAVFISSASLYLLSGLTLPLWFSAIGFFMLGFAVWLAWFAFGRRVISLASLCYAPVYAMLKIPVYLKFLVKRQVNWVRSKRDDL